MTKNPLIPVCGIGDDGSVLDIPAGYQLVQSIDTMVEGTHFPKYSDPYIVGHRLISVCVSDLAAMGATPHSFFLALTLPFFSADWLKKFTYGMTEAANKYSIQLLGGDTTQGSLTLSAHVQGLVPKGKAIYRSGAKPGDIVCVSGTLGDAAAGLSLLKNNVKTMQFTKPILENQLISHYFMPEARIALGQWFADNGVTSAIDVSDGLIADLAHILKDSNVGARIDSSQIPYSSAMKSHFTQDQSKAFALTGGDDYELCFTLNEEFLTRLDHAPFLVTPLGEITNELGVYMDGEKLVTEGMGFQHFTDNKQKQ